MENILVSVINNKLLGPNDGGLSAHTSQTIYIFNICEIKISDRDSPEEKSFEQEEGIEPLLITSNSILRHSELTC